MEGVPSFVFSPFKKNSPKNKSWLFVVHSLAASCAQTWSASPASPLHCLISNFPSQAALWLRVPTEGLKKRKYFVTSLYMYKIGERERCVYMSTAPSDLSTGAWLISNDRYLYISDLPLLHQKRKACVICNVSLFVSFVISSFSLYVEMAVRRCLFPI